MRTCKVVVQKIVYNPSGKWEDGELRIAAKTEIGNLEFIYKGEDATLLVDGKELKSNVLDKLDLPDFGEPSLVFRSYPSDLANKRFRQFIQKSAKKIVRDFVAKGGIK